MLRALPIRKSHRVFIQLALLISLWSLTACTFPPKTGPVVTSVSVRGNEQLETAEIEDAIATRATPKFLGLFRGILYEYETFDEHVLARDLERVERLYRARGYYHATARAGRAIQVEEDRVRVEIEVDEGPRTVVERIRIEGLEHLDAARQTRLRGEFQAELMTGDPLDEEQLEAARARLVDALQNDGYANATVHAAARVDLPRNRAWIQVSAATGRPAEIGKVTFHGLGVVPEQPVREAFAVEPGDPYSAADLRDAEQHVMDLGVFTSVTTEHGRSEEPTQPETTQEPTEAEPTGNAEGDPDAESKAKQSTAPSSSTSTSSPREIPIAVYADTAKLRTLRLGVGAKFDIIQTAVNVLAAWEHKNLFGGLRRFSASLRPGVVLYPTRVPDFAAPERLLPEVEAQARLEQPGLFEGRMRGFISSTYSIYPVLLQPNPPDNAPIIGYREFRGRMGVERRFGVLTLTPSQNLQTGVPFTYVGDLAGSSKRIYISYLEQIVALDLRDDPVDPSKGAYFATSAQFAGVGGDATDLRVAPEARFYLPVTRKKTSNLAMRLNVGLLFPFNYETPDGDNDPSIADTQISYFRSFFSGGPTSNRGYPYRGVGPHGPVSFFNPAIQAQQGGECDETSPTYDSRQCSVPLGGRALWEASIAYRFAVIADFSGALFCDASDISESISFRLNRPHLSCGLGPRYDTPVGPIRLDIAYRIPGLQVLGPNPRLEGDPGDIFGLPINVSLGVGEAY